MQRRQLTICDMQFIIDNWRKPSEVIGKQIGMTPATVRQIRREMGMIMTHSPGRKYSPEKIAELCNHSVPKTADMLEKCGYGNMRMSEVLQLCQCG